MFSGLNKIVKIILPKRLFYRALISCSSHNYITANHHNCIFDSIWIKANKNITRSLVAQLKTVQEIYQIDKKNLDFLPIVTKIIWILK